jgi:dihydrolipoamide dehydrogenase
METRRFDIAVIGAGPGGYVAAIKAAQLGRSVALIDKGPLGGTCLNVGCIPTKTLLAGSAILHKVQEANHFGIEVGEIRIEYSKMKARKDQVVDSIRKSLGGLLHSNQIQILQGTASFTGPYDLKVKGADHACISAEKIIIATGSEPVDLPLFPCDHRTIYNSTSILEMETLPKILVVIGGGYIGCEFASLYASLGVKVIILEALSTLVALQGKAIATALTKAFLRQGIEIRTGVTVSGIDQEDNSLLVRLNNGETVLCDKVLVAVGRKPYSAELNLGAAGLRADAKGFISVNERMETEVPGLYAIGDVTGKLLLAHVASHQGVVAGSNAAGGDASMHYGAVPAVIFTRPEIASVGLTEEEALEKGYQISIGKFPFQALGKSMAARETDGFSQILIEKGTGRILGAQVVGDEASILIAELTLAITHEIPIEDLRDTIHAHPTLSEAWGEAAFEIPIHLPPPRRNG